MVGHRVWCPQAHWLLRGKALECISLVGMAVGRDRFRTDAQSVLQWLQALQATELEADDPTLGYMQQVGNTDVWDSDSSANPSALH
jgi:hypothetical protein